MVLRSHRLADYGDNSTNLSFSIPIFPERISDVYQFSISIELLTLKVKPFLITYGILGTIITSVWE